MMRTVNLGKGVHCSYNKVTGSLLIFKENEGPAYTIHGGNIPRLVKFLEELGYVKAREQAVPETRASEEARSGHDNKGGFYSTREEAREPREEKKVNKQVFPFLTGFDGNNGAISLEPSGGLTLRQLYAGLAMAGDWAADEGTAMAGYQKRMHKTDFDDLVRDGARLYWRMADAMLETENEKTS